MGIEDKRAARDLIRTLYRRSRLDLSEVQVDVKHCVGYIAGIIRPMRGENLNLKDEMRVIEDDARRIPGIDDLVIEAKLENAARK